MLPATAINLLSGSAKGLEVKLRTRLDSPDELVRITAARVLAGIGDKECLPALKKGMQTWRWKEYLPLLMLLTEPGWLKIMDDIRLKDPAEGATVKTLVEEIASSLKDKGIDVRPELPEEVLNRRLARYPMKSLAGYGVGWISVFAQGTHCFFD